MKQKIDKIFSLDFILMSLTTFVSFCSFYFILIILPIYITQIGGKESEVGMIVGIFSFSAIIFRPFLSLISDLRGRKFVVAIGLTILTISPLIYNFTNEIWVLFLLRILHGFGWGAFVTTIFVMISEIIPPKKRGEAVGYWGIFINLAMAIAPVVGMFIFNKTNFFIFFLVSSIISLLGLLILIPVKETGKIIDKQYLKIELFEKKALFPSFILFLLTLSYASIITFLPLFTLKNNMNIGLFFTVYSFFLIILRGFSGRLSDIYGRKSIIIPGLIITTIGIFILSFSKSFLLFIIVAILYGIGFSAVQTSTMALAIDRSTEQNRSISMSTISISMDIGIGVGSVLWGFVLQLTNFNIMFLSTSVPLIIGIIYLLVNFNKD